MKQIEKLTLDGHFDVIQSTQSDLNGYHISDTIIYQNKSIELTKGDKIKNMDVETIIQININKYHILNSNMGIIIHKKT